MLLLWLGVVTAMAAPFEITFGGYEPAVVGPIDVNEGQSSISAAVWGDPHVAIRLGADIGWRRDGPWVWSSSELDDFGMGLGATVLLGQAPPEPRIVSGQPFVSADVGFVSAYDRGDQAEVGLRGTSGVGARLFLTSWWGVDLEVLYSETSFPTGREGEIGVGGRAYFRFGSDEA